MVLACFRSGLFNFRLLFAPENCLEVVYQIRDFWSDYLNFWLFIIKKRCNDVQIVFIDKTDLSDPNRIEKFWRNKLKTLAPYGLNVEQ